MANRDGDRKSASARSRKPQPVKKMAAVEDASPAQEKTPAVAPPPKRKKAARSSEPLPIKPKVMGPPRKPVQVLGDSKSFVVFCDDGTVCFGRAKKGTIKWIEGGPALPGSPADRREELGAELKEPK